MALAAGLVEEHLASILSNLDKKDGDIVARMMKIKPLLDIEIKKEILKLHPKYVLIRRCSIMWPKYVQATPSFPPSF